MSDELLDKWIATVQSKFKDGPPNGWLLHWDERRFHKPLAAIASSWEFGNWTSFDYSFCNKYEIKLNQGNDDTYWKLTVLVSFIVDAYSIHWTWYWQNGRQGTVVPLPDFPDFGALEARIRQFLETQGFIEVPEDWYSRKVPDVRLELSEESDVTLGKCLFEDYE